MISTPGKLTITSLGIKKVTYWRWRPTEKLVNKRILPCFLIYPILRIWREKLKWIRHFLESAVCFLQTLDESKPKIWVFEWKLHVVGKPTEVAFFILRKTNPWITATCGEDHNTVDEIPRSQSCKICFSWNLLAGIWSRVEAQRLGLLQHGCPHTCSWRCHWG